jgi:hypothetical protein
MLVATERILPLGEKTKSLIQPLPSLSIAFSTIGPDIGIGVGVGVFVGVSVFVGVGVFVGVKDGFGVDGGVVVACKSGAGDCELQATRTTIANMIEANFLVSIFTSWVDSFIEVLS